MSFGRLVRRQEDLIRCPWPTYEDLRRSGVHYSEEVDAYLVCGYRAIRQVLRDSVAYSATVAIGRPANDVQKDGEHWLRPIMLPSDGEVHARYRSIVNRAFTASRVQEWAPLVTKIASTFLLSVSGDREIELASSLAGPVPIRVISHILGLPQADADRFTEWASGMANIRPSGPVGGDYQRHCREQFVQYADGFFETLPGDWSRGVAGLIVEAERMGDLTRAESIGLLVELLIAGHITTTNHLLSSMALLGESTELWSALDGDRSKIPRFVEESLRLESPVQASFRLALKTCVVDNVSIPAGARLMLIYGAGNRDGGVWVSPSSIDFSDGTPRSHLAFGHGSHACLGASLVRLESIAILNLLLDTFSSFVLSRPFSELARVSSFINRGLYELPVRVEWR